MILVQKIRHQALGFAALLLFSSLFVSPVFAGLSDTSFFADMRFRHESKIDRVSSAGVAIPDQHLERLRLRFGATHNLSSELTLGVRVVSGDPDNPNSPHQSFGTAFHSFELSFDRFYVNYRPDFLPGFSVTAGKFSHPFQKTPVYGSLVWESDVQPEGVYIRYTAKKVNLILGNYLVVENPTNDMMALVAQVSTSMSLGNNLKTSVAIGYYGYDDSLRGGATVFCDNSGNATTGVDGTDCNGDGTISATKETPFTSDYQIINPHLALFYDGSAYPMVVSFEYIHNAGANIPQDSGWMVGASIGSTKKKGNWKLYYVRTVVEQDAVLTLTSQDDFLFQTNHNSHRLGLKYKLRDNVVAHPYIGVSEVENGGSGDNQWKARLDINIKIK